MNGTTPIARLLCAGPRRDGAAPDPLVTFCLSTEAGAGGYQGKMRINTFALLNERSWKLHSASGKILK